MCEVRKSCDIAHMRYLFIFLLLPWVTRAGVLEDRRHERLCARALAASVPLAEILPNVRLASSGRADLLWSMRSVRPVDFDALVAIARARGLALTFKDVGTDPSGRIVGRLSVEGKSGALTAFLTQLPPAFRALAFEPAQQDLASELQWDTSASFAIVDLEDRAVTVVRLNRYFAPRLIWLKRARRQAVHEVPAATLEDAVATYRGGVAFTVVDGVAYALGGPDFLRRLREVRAHDLAMRALTGVRDAVPFLR